MKEKLLGAVIAIALICLFFLSSCFAQEPIPTNQAIRAIIGESANQKDTCNRLSIWYNIEKGGYYA